jgi:hypothetical protein
MQLGTMAIAYERHTRSSSDLINTVNRLENEKGTYENKKQDAEEAAAAYDREFLERKADQSDPFKPDSLYTVQDFTTFFLFVSYCIFVLALALTLENKLVVIGVGVIFFMFACLLLYRYG